MDHVIFWSQFFVGAMLIVFAGIKLTKYGDVISEKTKLGHGFIGAVLIGWSTSLPELVLSIGTSSYLGKPDMTMGNVLGSNLFNLFILVLLDFYFLEGAILRFAKKSIKVSAVLSFVIVVAVGILLCMPQLVVGGVDAGPLKIGYNSILIFAIYMIAMVILYVVERGGDTSEEEEKYKGVSLKSILVKSFLVIGIIVGAGLWLSQLANQLESLYQLNESFIGSFFLAIVSSLPEVITCFVAVRMGFHSMAIGTLFGSNIFNMGILAFCDIFYTKAYMFQDLKPEFIAGHASSIMLVGLMTIVTILFLRSDTENKGKFFGVESLVIAALYGFSLYLSYQNPNFLTPLLNDLVNFAKSIG